MKILAPGFVVVFTLTILLLSSSCGKLPDDPIPGDTTVEDSLPYDIIWQTPQNITDSSGSYSPHFKPVIIGDLVINANNVFSYYFSSKEVDTITAYNIHTGEIIWKWSDFQASQKHVSQNATGKDMLYITNGKEVVGVHALTGETARRRFSNKGQKSISVSEDIVFHIDMDYNEKASDIVYFDNLNSEWKTAIRIQEAGHFNIRAFPPTAEIQFNGDTLLYFQKRFHQSEPYMEGSELYCFNLSTKEIVWNTIVDSLVSNIKNTPYLDESRVYFCSGKSVHCFDKRTGDRIWKTHFPQTNFLVPNYLMTDDLIVIGSDNGERIGVRKSNGSVAYNIKSYSTSFYSLNKYKNWLLNVHDQLEIFDINTGAKKMYINTNRKPGYFNTGVAVDESTGLFYLPDGYNMMCIRVKGL